MPQSVSIISRTISEPLTRRPQTRCLSNAVKSTMCYGEANRIFPSGKRTLHFLSAISQHSERFGLISFFIRCLTGGFETQLELSHLNGDKTACKECVRPSNSSFRCPEQENATSWLGHLRLGRDSEHVEFFFNLREDGARINGVIRGGRFCLPLAGAVLRKFLENGCRCLFKR